jgi:hypothetical protein
VPLLDVEELPGKGQSFGVYGAFLEAFDFLGMEPNGEILLVHDERSSQIYAMKRQGW